jgi:hypothetical protein
MEKLSFYTLVILRSTLVLTGVCPYLTVRDDASFPKSLLINGGQDFVADEGQWSKVIRDEDKEQGAFIVDPKFKTLIISKFAAEDCDEFLGGVLPLDQLAKIIIQPEL